MADTDVKIRLQLADAGATSGINKATQQVEQMQKRAAAATSRSASRQRTETEKLTTARTMLGTRSEHRIQREILVTEAAYNRLARSGKMSMMEQARAAEAYRNRITQLTNEMGKLTAAQTRQAKLARGAKWGQYAAIGGAGVTAAGMMLKEPVKKAMSYDRMLADLANTTYNDRDIAGRKAGMRELENTINAARRAGGGTRESVTEALNTMIAAGVVDTETSKMMLGDVVKGATASGASANDLALVAVRAVDNFKIDPKRMQGILSGAIRGGQLGGFELKDMGKWLGQQMAMGSLIGMKGEDDLAKLIAYNQVAVKTAGSAEQAGTNIKDMLVEFNTPHFARYAGELFFGGGRGKGAKKAAETKMAATYLDYQNRGMGKDEATLDLLNKYLSKNTRLAKLRSEYALIDKNDESSRKKNIEAQTAMIQGTAVGKMFHNQQSLAGFVSILNNLDDVKKITEAIKNQFSSGTELNNSFQMHADTSDYKVSQAHEESLVAQKKAIDKLTPAIGRAADGFSAIAREYPFLTGSTTLATTAISAMAGGATIAAFALSRLAYRIPMNVPGGAMPGGGKGKPSAGGRFGAGRNWKGAAITSVAAPVAAYLGGEALDATFGEKSRLTNYGKNALNGAAAGATIGSFFSPIGTAAGAAIGGVFGLVATAVKESFEGVELPKPQPQEVNLHVRVESPPDLRANLVNMNSSPLVTTDFNTGNIFKGAPL